MINVGIMGATGYTGIELCRILAGHPEARVVYAGTESYAGQNISKVYPHLLGHVDLQGAPQDASKMIKSCDVIFCALPHGLSMSHAQTILESGKKFIDLGADFRLKSSEAYEQWYKHPHHAPGLLGKAVYGLPEAGFRKQIKSASLVANPGCYPTTCTLAALPALRAGIVETTNIVFDSKSGTSGAGRSVSLSSHASEVYENVSAYNIAGKHRHTPEIEQALFECAGLTSPIQFTPHLMPISRGMLTTAYLRLKTSMSTQSIHDIYLEQYHHEPFVRVRPLGDLPQSKQVRGSNFCDIGLDVDQRTNQLIVVSVIDNLVKGASGSAVQNMNLLFGLDEGTGLNNLLPIFP